MPTYDIIGHQKETKYGFNTSLSKEKFKKQALTQLVITLFCFPMNVLMNIQGYDSITDILKRGQHAHRLCLKLLPTKPANCPSPIILIRVRYSKFFIRVFED